MSSALAIAGVTALLRDRLNDRIINHDVTSQVGNSVLVHEFPVITRKMIATAFQVPPTVGAELPAALRAVADCGLADQLELLKITPQTLSIDELSKLWTATQSSIRPSAAYQV
jgi:hypothetical protein